MNWLLKKFRWPKPFTIDLNKPAHRFRIAGAVFAALLVALGMLVGGVQAYYYTESTPFCGTVCHSMYPQAERHQLSPHANVDCSYCHVGPGAEAFVQSKIDGTRQLIGEITNDYNRPIPSPVHNLRPARETCEECHSPTTFTDNLVKIVQRYDDDEQNTPITSTIILKMGGWNPARGISKGIHWHVTNEVQYIAMDEKRQEIGWVGVRQPDGTLKEYYASNLIGMGQTGFVEHAREAGEVRTMDCIDCHNRTAHYIPYPEESVDQAITDELISRSLPFIRLRAVEILDTQFGSLEAANAAIDALADEYADADPKAVALTLKTLKQLYRSTHFPAMNLDWRSNPNNARHDPTLGCFRCHDGMHFTLDEIGQREAISVECNLCHTVPIVGRGDDLLVEAPVIVGSVPETHEDFSWTLTHRDITDAEEQSCYACHGQAFCNNGICHNLSHPEDMLFTHAESYRLTDNQTCYVCHQSVTCIRCHEENIIKFP